MRLTHPRLLSSWCVSVAGLLALAFLISFHLPSDVSNVSIRPAPAAAAASSGGVPQDYRANPALRTRDARLTNPKSQIQNPKLVTSYGRLPLAFEHNEGQTDSQVKFISRGRGYTMFLTGSEAVLALRAGNQKEKVKGQMAKVEARAHSLLLSPAALFAGATNNAQPTTHALPINNLQSTIDNSPAPSPESLAPSVVRMKLVGANPKAKVTGLDPLPGKSNYFIGNDPKKWRTNVSNYAKVKYEGVYPGIDLVYYGNQGQLEYDWVVAPGADPKAIAFEIETGNSKLENGNSPDGAGPSKIQNLKSKIDKNGDLVIPTDAGEVRFHKPVVYQPVAPPSGRHAGGTPALQPNPKSPDPGSSNSPFTIHHSQFVDGRFVLTASNQVRFEVGPYDKSRPLFIDPVVIYAAYLGGAYQDFADAVAVDDLGNAYIVGGTNSLDFPTANAYQSTYRGAGIGLGDLFITKLNPAGTSVLFSTYLGGTNGEEADSGIGIDSFGSAYVTGMTWSADFPVTPGAFQTTFGGGEFGLAHDAFVAKLTPGGDALAYSTYLGGNGPDDGSDLAVDSSGHAYVVGSTNSPDFPATTRIPDGATSGGFVAKLDADGKNLIYSTILGGPEFGALIASIAADPEGSAYITGYTFSTNFPVVNAAQPACALNDYGNCEDAFVAKLDPLGSTLVFSTFLGGSGSDQGNGIAVDQWRAVYVTGVTTSGDFPVTPNAYDKTCGTDGNCNPHGLSDYPSSDAFVTKISASGDSLEYSTYLGGGLNDPQGLAPNEAGEDIAVDSAGNAYVVGYTVSFDFPTANPIQPSCGLDEFNQCNPDIFIAKLNPDGSALLFSTYFGGGGWESGRGVAFDELGNVIVIGSTDQTDFLVTLQNFNRLFGNDGTYSGGMFDAFVLKISPGVAPQVGVSQISVGFADQAAGTVSEGYPVTLGNFTSVPLTIDSLDAVNPDGSLTSDFYIDDHGCKKTYAVGERCTVDAYFSPQTGSAAALSASKSSTQPPASVPIGGTPPTAVKSTRIGKLRVSTSISSSSALKGFEPSLASAVALTTNTADIDLKGDALVSGVLITPASLTFSNQTVGTTSAVQTVELANGGAAALTIASLSTSAEFDQTNTCGTSVAAGGNCTINVTFKPAAAGDRTGTLTISDDAVPGTQTVALSGTGNDFSVSFPPGEDSKTVTAGQPATYNLSIAPSGLAGSASLSCAWQGTQPRGTNCAVSPASVTLDGVSAAPFTVTVTTTARSLAAPQVGGGRAPGAFPAMRTSPLQGLLALLMLLMLVAVAALYERRPKFAGHRPALQQRTSALRWAPLAATLLLVLLWAACGGGIDDGGGGTGTPAGTYNLTLTATAGGVSRTTSLSLTVN